MKASIQKNTSKPNTCTYLIPKAARGFQKFLYTRGTGGGVIGGVAKHDVMHSERVHDPRSSDLTIGSSCMLWVAGNTGRKDHASTLNSTLTVVGD